MGPGFYSVGMLLLYSTPPAIEITPQAVSLLFLRKFIADEENQ